jgi:hypothetical protein
VAVTAGLVTGVVGGGAGVVLSGGAVELEAVVWSIGAKGVSGFSVGSMSTLWVK